MNEYDLVVRGGTVVTGIGRSRFGKGVSPAQLHLLFSFSLLRAPCLACSRPASALYWEYHRRHRSRESSPVRETNSRSNRAMSELGQNRKRPMRAYVFRFAPNNGHRQDTSACPFRANIRSSSGSIRSQSFPRVTHPPMNREDRVRDGFVWAHRRTGT